MNFVNELESNDEGQTLETSASLPFYGGDLTLINPFDSKKNFISLPTEADVSSVAPSSDTKD